MSILPRGTVIDVKENEMKKASATLTFLLCLFLCSKAQDMLWYDSTAQNWLQALPLGNSHTGAMAFGGTQDRVIRKKLEESILDQVFGISLTLPADPAENIAKDGTAPLLISMGYQFVLSDMYSGGCHRVSIMGPMQMSQVFSDQRDALSNKKEDDL